MLDVTSCCKLFSYTQSHSHAHSTQLFCHLPFHKQQRAGCQPEKEATQSTNTLTCIEHRYLIDYAYSVFAHFAHKNFPRAPSALSVALCLLGTSFWNCMFTSWLLVMKVQHSPIKGMGTPQPLPRNASMSSQHAGINPAMKSRITIKTLANHHQQIEFAFCEDQEDCGNCLLHQLLPDWCISCLLHQLLPDWSISLWRNPIQDSDKNNNFAPKRLFQWPLNMASYQH